MIKTIHVYMYMNVGENCVVNVWGGNECVGIYAYVYILGNTIHTYNLLMTIGKKKKICKKVDLRAKKLPFRTKSTVEIGKIWIFSRPLAIYLYSSLSLFIFRLILMRWKNGTKCTSAPTLFTVANTTLIFLSFFSLFILFFLLFFFLCYTLHRV